MTISLKYIKYNYTKIKYLIYTIKRVIIRNSNKIPRRFSKRIITNTRYHREIDKELPYFIIISSIYENIGLPLLYIISIDKITQLFEHVHKIILRWRRLVAIGLNPIEALLCSALSSKSKRWRELIINYITLQKIGGSAAEFFNRKVEEALNEIKQTWKRYHDNIVFIIEVFMITIFSTVILLLLSILLGSTIIGTNIVITLFITITTIISIIIIDNIMPIKFRHYIPRKYTVIVSIVILIIAYQVINWKNFLSNNVIARVAFLVTISTLPLAIENFVYYTIDISRNNHSILNLLDYIITSQRFGIPLTKLKSSINSTNILTKRVKDLFNISLNGKNVNNCDYKERIIVSLIIGLKYVGLMPYELLLKLRNILSEIISIEKSTRKTLNVITILTILLPSILMTILFILVRSLTGIQAQGTGTYSVSYLNLFSRDNTENTYISIYMYSMILSLSLNTIISKAVDLSLRSYWRIHISVLLLTISYYLVLLLLHRIY